MSSPTNGPIRAASACLCAITLAMAACGGGNDDDSASNPTATALSIVATADSASVAPGRSVDLLTNDTLGGATATASSVTASAVGTWPTGITLNGSGVLTVDRTATPGSSTLTYRICQTTLPSNCTQADVNLTVAAVGSLTGRALDAATATAIAGVTVRSGSASAVTDANGNFTLEDVPATERAVVVFDSPLYAESARIAAVRTGATTDVQARLLPVGTTVRLPVAAGGTASAAQGPARVTLPANGVQRADGTLPTGDITVLLTAIDPATDSSAMPGDFTTRVGSVLTPIESFGALNVRLLDSGGQPLNLRSGLSATIRIPVATRSATTPATIPLFYLDPTTGSWVQEGTATLSSGGGQAYYEGTVTHFSTWNADQVYDTVSISGCVSDADGAPVADALVSSDGIDYSGTSTARTDAAGHFVLPLRMRGTATVASANRGMLTNTRRVGPYDADTALPECLSLSQTGAGVTMKLTWGATPSDLDSHLVAPDGSHVSYLDKGSLALAPFASLDVDDVSSYGPEVVTVNRLMVGTYKYSVNNYSGYSEGSITASGARVELNVPGRSLQLFVPPGGENADTDWWHLFELDVDSHCNITVRRVDRFDNSEPSNPTGTPTYCTPS